jgi:hypothetical protein
MSGYEPRDVGPRVGGDLPCAPADRGLVLDVLAAAAREGRLHPQEHARRAALAQAAVTFDDLIPLTRDLQAPAAPFPPGAAAQSVVPYRPPPAPAARPAGLQLYGVFSGFERKGPWSPPGTITAVTVFGGGELDLRDAQWTTPTVEVTVTALFGGLEIKVPQDTEVVNEVFSVFGGASVKGRSGIGSGRRLVVKGFCGFGGVGVKVG